MTIITLTGDYGYTQYKLTGFGGGTIDASAASWELANQGSPINLYPFVLVNAGSGTHAIGGTINGHVSQTAAWEDVYVNSAAIRFENAPSIVIEDWRIDKPWDAVRVTGSSDGFLIDNVWVSNYRDDGVENDDALSGTIRDSLFDGGMGGFSFGDSGTGPSDSVVTIDGVLVREQLYLRKGEITHGSPFKMNTDLSAEDNVDLRVFNSVVAIQDPDHNGLERLAIAWENMIEASGNYFLNLSDTPFASDYPLPGVGWTVLQGADARAHWAQERTEWVENRGDPDPPPPPPPPPANVITGTSGANDLVGTNGIDDIRGLGGNDKLKGLLGDDILTGGAGSDRFIFNTAIADNLDDVTDFVVRVDQVRLDNAIFTRLGSDGRRLPSSFFESQPPNDSNDYIIYDKVTGMVSYDADGNGAGAGIEFAQLDPNLALTAYDFYVI